jgi:hypothetical protein
VGGPNTALQQVLADLSWRPEDLAAALNECARRHGRGERLHPKTPHKWVWRGDHPRPPWPGMTAQIVSALLGRLVTPHDLGWRAQPWLIPADQGMGSVLWTPDGALQAMRDLTQAGPMQRRQFLAVLGGAMTVQPLQWLLAAPISTTASARGGRLSLEVVDEVDQAIAGVRRLDDQVGGGALLDLVAAHLAYVQRLLSHSSYTDTVGRRLYSSAAELQRLAGWLAFDGGDHGQAQRYWLSGLRAAHTAGDDALGANIVGFMSCLAKDQNSGGREAVTLADTALSGYHGASPRVQAILALRSAEALATVGEVTGCRRQIDRAFDRLADAGSPASPRDPQWAYWMVDTQAHAQAGFCYQQLGDWRRARGHLQAALRSGGGGESREGVLRQVLLAGTYLRQEHPDPDRAVAMATTAITSLEGTVDSARCVGHLRGLVQDLLPHQRRGAPVRDLVERATDLMAVANT